MTAEAARSPLGRDGYSLAEATISLLLAGLLIACLAAALAGIGRLARAQAETSVAAETERTAAAVLGAELRWLTAADLTAADDSVRLRAFRGAGVVCAVEADRLLVDYAGVRLPEPDKDSLLLLGAGGERAVALEDAAPASPESCGDPAGRVFRLEAATDPLVGGPPAMVLVFETGAYSVSGSAVRYRRGAGGRQPLTETTLNSTSGLMHRPLTGVAAALLLRLDQTGHGAAAAPFRYSVLLPQGGATPRLIVDD